MSPSGQADISPFQEKSFKSGIHHPLALPQRPLANTFGQHSYHFGFLAFLSHLAFLLHIIGLVFCYTNPL
jgi:hypothetical protein